MSDVDFKCSNCVWQGNFVDFLQFHKESCEGGKKQVIEVKDLSNHISKECEQVTRNENESNVKSHFEVFENLKNVDGCYYRKFGCYPQDSLTHESFHDVNLHDYHLKLITKYFTNEIQNIKTIQTQRFEELKEENISLKKNHNEAVQKIEYLSRKIELLSSNILPEKFYSENKDLNNNDNQEISISQSNNNVKLSKMLSATDEEILHHTNTLSSKNLINILKEESCKEIIELNDDNSITIKKQNILLFTELITCTVTGDFSPLVEALCNICNEFLIYKEKLKDMLANKYSIFLTLTEPDRNILIFKRDSFKFYQDSIITFELEDEKFHFKVSKNISNDHIVNMAPYLCILNWKINLSSSSMIDIGSPDKMFAELNEPIRSNYGLLAF